MKAAVYHGPNKLEIADVAEPQPLTGQEMPLTMGHEFSGTITDVGAGVTGYVPGDRVAIEPIYR